MLKREAERIVADVEAEDTEVLKKTLENGFVYRYRTASGEIIDDWDYETAKDFLKDQVEPKPDEGGRPRKYEYELGYAHALHDNKLGIGKSGRNSWRGAYEVTAKKFELDADNLQAAGNYRKEKREN